MTDVIIIDDDAIFGELIVEQLRAANIDCAFHHGWYKSSVVVKEAKPKLLLIDVNMPGMPGPVLIGTLEKLLNVMPKVVLMSSMDLQEIEKLVKKFGADAALSKSASDEEVVAMVRAFVHGASAADSARQ